MKAVAETQQLAAIAVEEQYQMLKVPAAGRAAAGSDCTSRAAAALEYLKQSCSSCYGYYSRVAGIAVAGP